MNTQDEVIEHGRKWIGAGWEWQRGQVGLVLLRDRNNYASGVVTEATELGEIIEFKHVGGGFGVCWGVVPDLRDDGTIGHALGQVRRAWRRRVFVEVTARGYRPCAPSTKTPFGIEALTGKLFFRLEGEALLAARMSAP